MKDKSARLWTPAFLLVCVANFLMGFSFHLLTPTLPFYIVEHFNADKAVVGVVLSCYIIAGLLIRPVSGYLADTFHRKHIYLFSYICFATLFLGYLFAYTIALLILLRVFHGFAWGLASTAGSTLSIDIMPAGRRGEGIGYFGLTSNLAMALGPLAGMFLHDHFPFDFIFYTSILSGSLGVVAALGIRAPSREPKIHAPLSLDRFIMLKGIPLGVNFMILAIPYGMILPFSAMYGKEMNVADTGMFFTYLAIGIGGSRIFSGRLVDNGKIHVMSAFGLIILTGGFSLFSLGSSAFTYFFSALLIGVGYGTLFPAFLTMFVNMAPHNQRGTANSTYLTSFDLGVGIGMILAGKIAHLFNLSTAYGLGALFMFLAFLYYLRISKSSYELRKLI